MGEHNINFKPLIIKERKRKVKLKNKFTFFFGSYPGHGKQIRRAWNSICQGSRVNRKTQMDRRLSMRIMGSGKKKY